MGTLPYFGDIAFPVVLVLDTLLAPNSIELLARRVGDDRGYGPAMLIGVSSTAEVGDAWRSIDRGDIETAIDTTPNLDVAYPSIDRSASTNRPGRAARASTRNATCSPMPNPLVNDLRIMPPTWCSSVPTHLRCRSSS
ncbi:MAG: hypothetical protein ABIR68_19735 [Ilumatobacteraceae bacterium]